MNNKLIILIAACLIFASCKKIEKDPLDYYPNVRTVSAVVQDDGSVLVTGEIISEGASEILYSGFCMDLVNDPSMLSNQVICQRNGNFFTTVYENFDITKKYFFRSWAANDYGYTYGNTISLDSITAIPVIPPCSMTPNTTNFGAGTETFTNVGSPIMGFDDWTLTASTGGTTFTLTFGEKPKTRKYVTASYANLSSPGFVKISFNSGFIYGSVDDGADFYVNQTGLNQYEMTLCTSPYSYQNSTLSIRLNFDCPL